MRQCVLFLSPLILIINKKNKPMCSVDEIVIVIIEFKIAPS